MKRAGPLLLVPLAIGAAWFALAASLRAERDYGAIVHELAEGGDARVLESSFERGWLTSRAETSAEVSGGAGFAFQAGLQALGASDVRDRVGMRMVHEIEHGPLPLLRWVRDGCSGAPILARIRSTVEIDQESQLALAEALGKLPPIEAETIVRASGHAETTFSMHSQSLRAKGDGYEREGRWLGLDGELTFSDSFRHVNGIVRAPGLESRGPDRAFELRDVVWAFDLPASELPVGRVTLEFDRLSLESTSAGVPGVVLDGVELEAESRLTTGRFGATLALDAGSIGLGSDWWGPGSMRLVLDDVDGQALLRLRRAGLGFQSRLAAGGDPAKTAVAAVDVLEALPQLLARSPRLALQHLQLATPQGAVSMQGHASLTAPDTSGAVSLGSFVDAELELRAPATVFDTLLDARARSELTSEGVAPGDDEAFQAKIRERRAAILTALQRQGQMAAEGDRTRLRFSWKGSTAKAEVAGAAPHAAPPAPPPPAQVPPPEPEAPAAASAAGPPETPPAAPDSAAPPAP